MPTSINTLPRLSAPFLKRLLYQVVNISIVQHLAFWSLSFYLLSNHFAVSNRLTSIDFVYAALFHGALIPVVYLNLSVAIPYLFQKSRYFRFTVILIALLGLGLVLHDLIYGPLLHALAPGYYIISYSDYWELSKVFGVYLAISSLLKLSKSWFVLVKSQEVLAQVAKEKAELELHRLQAQLNPHFLFNSLNSIYSLALDNAEHTADTVLKLSNMLRYVLYETHGERVELEKELTFIAHFLALQKMRLPNPDIVSYQKDGQTSNWSIAPLLFAPLLENSFKHGIQGARTDGFLDIHLHIHQSKLSFMICNNLGKSDSPDASPSGGIGLLNLQKRLDLLYPNQHQLTIDKENDTFKVQLTIVLDRKPVST